MKRIVPLLTIFIWVTAISCNPLKDYSLNSITELYDGSISIEKGMRASTSKGRTKFLKLTVEENTFAASGWLSPEAIANNCAMLFEKANPQTFDGVDLLEIEIINSTSNLFEYRKKDIDNKSQTYKNIESFLANFINILEANNIDEAVHFIKSDSSTNAKNKASFLKTVRSILPTKHKGTKLIGYRESKQSEKGYDVDFVVISLDDVQRMLKATLEEEKNGLIFYSITI
ncbi:MAG: hypothetical protein ACTHMM_13830 [Agriterribacter sp.]